MSIFDRIKSFVTGDQSSMEKYIAREIDRINREKQIPPAKIKRGKSA
ncbi:MAG: hypothetical protein IJ575_08030 [Selenomonadaceae bacterium]|nr:hypothetical protein [Selenomonadaceae bacterium]